MSNNQPVKVLHTFGPKPCGEPAYLWVGSNPPVEGDAIDSENNIQLLDGETPKRQAPTICGSCGEMFYLFLGLDAIAEALNKAKPKPKAPPILSDFF